MSAVFGEKSEKKQSQHSLKVIRIKWIIIITAFDFVMTQRTKFHVEFGHAWIINKVK